MTIPISEIGPTRTFHTVQSPPTSYIFKNFVSIPSIFKENKTKPTAREKNKLKGSPKLGNIPPYIRFQNCNLPIHE